MENAELEKILTQEGHADFVEYFIFPDIVANSDDSQKNTLLTFTAAIQELAKDYIWHKESIVLKQENAVDFEENISSDHKYLPCFHGTTQFGDNIEDEWFITWILLELTKKFPGCVIRMIDNDGEFLLIEAADHLPKWAESDSTCQQRVYLYNGNVHLIPATVLPGESGSSSSHAMTIPSMADAVHAVRTRPQQTIASESVQVSINSRIGNYPEKMLENLYYANLMLPPKLAAILDQQPDLIALGVNTFYSRDPIISSAVKLMKNFKPGECLVKSRVRFTKCLYAMLSKQDFRPDPKIGWAFPRPTSCEFKAHSLGAKLTMGFEILLSKAQDLQDLPNDETAVQELESSAGWLSYLHSLQEKGYFKDLLEGSRQHKELKEKALVFYRHSILGERQSLESGSTIDAAVRKLYLLFKSVEFDQDKMMKNSTSLPLDDDDSWMQITPDKFDSLLAEQFKVPNKAKPEDIPEKLKEFMKNISEFDGIDLPSKSAPDSDKPSSLDGPLDALDFRADDFVSAMDKLLLELGKPDDDLFCASDDGSSFSDEEGMDEIMKKHSFKKDSKLYNLMKEMDKELTTTDVGKSFTVNDEKSLDDDEFDDVESFEPVNIDINALTNMLKSFQSQEFPTGPSTNLLKNVSFDISKVEAKTNAELHKNE